MNDNNRSEQDAESAAQEVGAKVCRTWQSNEIFLGDREVLIVHGEETYRLLRTKNGKLILQK